MGLSQSDTPLGQAAPVVVIVDDEEEIRHALRLLFEFEDFVVAGEAADGIEAIALVRQHQPDFVILDYRMPRMDGEAASVLIKSVAPRARIVAFSAVLDSKPEWADSFLNKDRIADIAPLLTTLIPLEATRARGLGAIS